MKNRDPFFWLTWGIGGGFVVAVHLRILTYVCGNDPMLYIRAARTFLSPGLYGSEAVREAATFVVPGYPFILAVTIGIFGSLSPYWLNLVFVLLTIPFLYSVFHSLMRSPRAACFSILGLFWILFQGHALHAPYLLYPFREASRIFFVTFCFWSFLRGIRGAQPKFLWILFSSFSLLAACGIREPTAFLLPGFLAGTFVVFPKEHPRFKTLGVFLIPWGVIGVVVLCLIFMGYLENFSQFSVASYLRNHETALQRIRDMLPWFPERSGGWIGIILVGAGVFRSIRKARTLFFWFAVPALFLFIFYAYVHMHVRYFMTTLIFLLPFAGYGLDGFLEWGEARFGHVRLPVFSTGLVLLVVLYGMIRTAESMEVWGQEATAKQVREWQKRIDVLDKGVDGRVHIAVEQRCRYLEDMILSYTDANILDPKRTEEWSDDAFPAHYFYPLNRAAFYATPQWLDYKEMFAHRQIEHAFNLLPVDNKTSFIGRGEYREYSITPFTSGTHQQTLKVTPGKEHLLWLDWGSVDSDIPRDLMIFSPGQPEPILSKTLHGKGIQVLKVPATMKGDETLLLRVRSEQPVPEQPVFHNQSDTGPFLLEVGTDRRLSSNFLLTNRKNADVRAVYPTLRTDRLLSFRVPVGHFIAEDSLWNVTPEFEKLPSGEGWVMSVVSDKNSEPTLLPLQKGHPVPSFQMNSDQEVFLQLLPPSGSSEDRQLNLQALQLQLGKAPSAR